jgi:membrane protein required for colicin V production
MANIVAFIIILGVVTLLALLAAFLLQAMLKAISLGWLDRVGGAVLGFVTSAIFISAILASIVKFFGQGPVTESLIAAILLDKFPIVLGLLPGDYSSIRNFFR